MPVVDYDVANGYGPHMDISLELSQFIYMWEIELSESLAIRNYLRDGRACLPKRLVFNTLLTGCVDLASPTCCDPECIYHYEQRIPESNREYQGLITEEMWPSKRDRAESRRIRSATIKGEDARPHDYRSMRGYYHSNYQKLFRICDVEKHLPAEHSAWKSICYAQSPAHA